MLAGKLASGACGGTRSGRLARAMYPAVTARATVTMNNLRFITSSGGAARDVRGPSVRPNARQSGDELLNRAEQHHGGDEHEPPGEGMQEALRCLRPVVIGCDAGAGHAQAI